MEKIIKKIKEFFFPPTHFKTLRELQQYDDIFIIEDCKPKKGFCCSVIKDTVVVIYCYETEQTYTINISENLDDTAMCFENKILKTYK